MKIALWSAWFSELKENRVDHTFWLHLWKNKQKMKTGWTTHSWNKAIWLALSLCHMTMTRKINKLEKPGGPQGNFHALFGRSAAFYGHFRVDTVTSEWSTRILASFIIYHFSLCILIKMQNAKGSTKESNEHFEFRRQLKLCFIFD